MNIYSPTHPGAPFSTSELSTLGIEDNSTAAGYFRREDLVELLKGKENGSVGIRIYQISGDGLIATSVNAQGFDGIDNIFFLCGSALDGGTDPANNLDSSEAADEVGASPLTAFFSNSVLEECLKDPLVSGISFYQIDLKEVTQNKFSSPEVASIKNALKSYMAVATILEDNGDIPKFNSANTTTAILSDQPCPGYCAALKVISVAGTLPRIDGIELTEREPYLIPWG